MSVEVATANEQSLLTNLQIFSLNISGEAHRKVETILQDMEDIKNPNSDERNITPLVLFHETKAYTIDWKDIKYNRNEWSVHHSGYDLGARRQKGTAIFVHNSI